MQRAAALQFLMFTRGRALRAAWQPWRHCAQRRLHAAMTKATGAKARLREQIITLQSQVDEARLEVKARVAEASAAATAREMSESHRVATERQRKDAEREAGK